MAYLRGLAVALIAYAGLTPSPVNYLALPGGERGTVLMPPAVEDNSIMIVIRKHAVVVKSLTKLNEEGAFEDVRDVSFNTPSASQALQATKKRAFNAWIPSKSNF